MSLPKVAGVLCVASLFWSAAAAQQASTVTEQDRADIQALVARYQTALSTCASQEYASLFVPDGVFISDDFRGKRHREMYGPMAGSSSAEQSSQSWLTPRTSVSTSPGSARRGRARRRMSRSCRRQVGPRAPLSSPTTGATKTSTSKTSEGWRFKVRRVVMPTRPAGGGEK